MLRLTHRTEAMTKNKRKGNEPISAEYCQVAVLSNYLILNIKSIEIE